jgi:hypothetical protein
MWVCTEATASVDVNIAIAVIAMKKWFFIMCFVAALFCSIFWTGVIIFSIATHRLATMGIRGLAVLAPLLFFIWGAVEMFQSVRNAGHSE